MNYDMEKEKQERLIDILTNELPVLRAQLRISQQSGLGEAGSSPASNRKEVKLDDGGLYVGEVFADQPHGSGKCVYPNGAAYVGQWAFGKCSGRGTQTWANGAQYVGEWKDGKRSGQGTLTNADGSKWSGEWRDDREWTGSGKTVYYTDGKPNGNAYAGQWAFGKRSGQGTFTWANGDQYVGEWRDDKRGGQGTLAYADGSKWSGEWKDDKEWMGSGRVIYHLVTYQRYNTDRDLVPWYEWKPGGRWTGPENATWWTGPENATYYEGEWRDGKRHGQGTFIWADGGMRSWRNVKHNGNSGKYEGEWRDDQRSGQGTLTWPNGDQYVGEWLDDKFQGKGTITNADGSKWSGEFHDGGPYKGSGKIKTSEGEYVGRWKYGFRTGWGTQIFSGGSSCSGIWSLNRIKGLIILTDKKGRKHIRLTSGIVDCSLQRTYRRYL